MVTIILRRMQIDKEKTVMPNAEKEVSWHFG